MLMIGRRLMLKIYPKYVEYWFLKKKIVVYFTWFLEIYLSADKYLREKDSLLTEF